VDDHSSGWATPLPRSLRDRLRTLAPPALLVAIASLGVYRASTVDQSSWQGVTFGMFATYDNTVSRIVRVTIDGPGSSYRADLPADLRDDATRLRVVPTDAAAAQLARAVLPRVAGDGGTGVRVEVWRLRLRSREGVLRLHLEPLAAGEAAR
jgi:hypothetical protein